MGIATKAGNEVNGWIKLAIIIVIGSVVLLKFRGISSVGTCASGYTYSTTAFTCYNASNSSATNATPTGLFTTINSFVSAFSEPSNWVAIAIIALIGAGMLYYFNKKGN